MTVPQRVRLSRAKGARLPNNAVKVDRSTRWGNPFDFRAAGHSWTALAYGSRGDPAGRHEASVKAFREWIDPGGGRRVKEIEFQVGFGADDGSFVGFSPRIQVGLAPTHEEIRAALAGKNLACWCKIVDKNGDYVPCHADVLLSLANGVTLEEVKRENLRRSEGEKAR